MSAKRPSLNSKPLIAVVLVLIAAVAAFNVHTFGGVRQKRHLAQVRLQSAPPFPVDLNEVVRSSGESPAGPAPARDTLAALARDPFNTKQPVARTASRTTRMTKRSRAGHRSRKTSSLHCDAVFPGGKAPLALIQGKAYHLGDKVSGYEVGSISATGVKLMNRHGKKLFLAVGTESEEQGASRVITNLPAGDHEGRTRLVEYEHSERKQP